MGNPLRFFCLNKVTHPTQQPRVFHGILVSLSGFEAAPRITAFCWVGGHYFSGMNHFVSRWRNQSKTTPITLVIVASPIWWSNKRAISSVIVVRCFLLQIKGFLSQSGLLWAGLFGNSVSLTSGLWRRHKLNFIQHIAWFLMPVCHRLNPSRRVNRCGVLPSCC